MANDIIDIIVTDNSDNVQLNVTPNLVSINVSQTSGNIIGSNYYLASTFSALPITGDLTTLYVINDTSLMYRWSGSAYTQINSSAVVAWGQITGTLSGQTDLQNALNAKAPLASPTFTGTVSGITKSMVGLSNVDNTSDVNKPISTATQTALNLKADINNPTFTGTVGGITKAMVGLSDVDNTSDVNKPISSATQTALDTKAPLASPTFTGTVSGITKSMVGLGNVDNTTDLNKPISTATQTALNLKYDASNPSGYTTNVGTVTSVGGTGTVSGLSLSGTVTTSGNLTLGGTLSLTSGNVTTALGYTPYDATNPSGYISGITSGNVTTALGYTPENAANKGVANGYASLDGGGLVPSTQLPSYVDDVLEFADLAAFPASGATGKIYVALDTNKIYRWSGATYIEVSPTVGTIWGGITGTLSNQTDLQNALNTKQNNLSGTGFVKSTAGTISYDTATYYPYPTGDTTQYVAGDGSLIAFPVAGQAGTLVRLVRNQTGATLTKGTVVYITGATGNNPIVEKALATSDSTSAQTFGLCQANIANNAEGYVVLTGDLTGIDTSAFTEGQQLYLSPTTAGTYTTTKQYAPNHLVYIGVITRSHPTLGQIEVKIQNGYELDEIHNVSAQSPANNDIIAFNTSNSLWEKKSIATALGFTPYNATNPNNYIALTALSSSATGLTYTNTTGVFSLTAGYAIPTTASATNWDTAYTNRITSLTTTGSSGSATLVSNVLNIPTYTLSGLGGITASFLSGTSGISYNSTTGVISTSLTQYTDALARASVSLTTTGTSGASTYNSTTGVFNIPQYQAVLTNPVTGTGTTNYVSKFTSSSTIGNSQIFDNGTNVGISTNSPDSKLTVNGQVKVSDNTLQGFYQSRTSDTAGNGVYGGSSFVIRNGATSEDFSIDIFNRTSIAWYNALKLANNGGAATFSSSVTATGLIVNTSSQFTAGGTAVNSIYANGPSTFGISNSDAIYLRRYGVGEYQFQTVASGVSAGNLSLQSYGGNVGIGTTSPSVQLHISRTFGDLLRIEGSSTGNNTTYYSAKNGSGDLMQLGIANAGYSSGTYPAIIARGAYLYSPRDLGIIAENGFNILFQTGSSERMRILNGGSVLFGTTTATGNSTGSSVNVGVTIGGGVTSSQVNNNANNYWSKASGYTSGDFTAHFVNGTYVGGISTNGSTTNYAVASDYRLKQDLKDFLGVDLVNKIKTYDYEWKTDKTRMYGVLAHELTEVLPYAVVGEKDNERMQSVDYSKLTPILVKAIQELSAEITILKNK